MRSGNVAACAMVFVLCSAAAETPIPHLEKRGAVTHLVVDGKPWLSLGGELLNNSASTAEFVRPIWTDLAKRRLNTVLVGVGWGWIEPEPGKYDFATLDALLADARSNNLRVVLLWFGSWKNGTSSYAPAWVRRNWQKYPIARDREGKGREILSAFSETNREADAQAYAAMLRHVREVDSATRTVIMIQLENEVGVLGDARDRSKQANEAFAGPVPKELLDYLQKRRATLLPETRTLWEAAGGKTSGTWQEVFGKGPAAEEALMAWHYARYMNRVAEAGKKEYPLPVFVNAWLVQPPDTEPGLYPSGGPQAHNHDFWRAGAPQIDALAPDIYLPNFAEIGAEYSRGGNPLFIPETRPDAANAFYAFGELNAQMYSPFGIDTARDDSLAKAYDVLRQLTPMIVEHQGKGTMKAVMVETGRAARKIQVGNYTFDCVVGRGWGATKPAGGRGYAIVIQTAADEFWIAGADLNVQFASATPATPLASIAAAEEGRFEDGAWKVKRRLAGDDIGMGGDERASLQLTSDPRIVRVSLFSYR